MEWSYKKRYSPPQRGSFSNKAPVNILPAVCHSRALWKAKREQQSNESFKAFIFPNYEEGSELKVCVIYLSASLLRNCLGLHLVCIRLNILYR